MANQILLKRASGSDPTASDLALGEIAIRTDNGKLFTKKDNGTVAEISGAGGGNNFFINTLSSSSGSGGGSASFNGTATRFELSNPPNLAAQLLVSIDGVIQKPNTGTSPSEGFAVDGNDIIFSSAPANGADFFIVTYASLALAEPSDNTVTSAKIVDGAIVNADINASAAIAGTKIAPDFGNQIVRSGEDFFIDVRGKSFRTNDWDIFNTTSGNGLSISGGNSTSVKIAISKEGNVDVVGNITVGGTVDGVDIAARNTLFGGLTSSSGVLTNGVTATTQSASDNSTKVATTAYTDTAISNLVNSAPSTLDTLNELAAALGDDPNFATTVTNSIATKLPLAGGTLTGNLTFADNVRARFGTNADLQIYHDGSQNIINGATSQNLEIQTNAFRVRNQADSESMIVANADSAVELYHDASLKFETHTNGVKVHGNIFMDDNDEIRLGDSGDFQLFHNSSTGEARIFNSNAGGINIITDLFKVKNNANNETLLNATNGGGVELYFNNSKKFETFANGVRATNNGNIKLASDSGKFFMGAGDDAELFHDGTNLTLNGDGTNSTFLRAKSGENSIVLIPDGGVELYHNNSKKLETTANGTQFDGRINFTGTGQKIDLIDNQEIRIGTGDDLTIYHNGTHSYIVDGGTGELRLGSNSGIRLTKHDSETVAFFDPDGACELYHDNSKKFDTNSGGVKVHGNLDVDDNNKLRIGNSSDLQIFHDGSNSFIKHNGAGDFYVQTSEASVEDLYLQAGNDVYIRVQTGETAIKAIGDGAVELYFDNSKKFNTTSTGVSLTGTIHTVVGDFYPANDNNDRLGLSNRRWSQVQGYEFNIAEFAKFFDNIPAKFGNGDDLKIYSDGTNGILEGGGTGANAPLFLNANTIRLQTQSGGEKYINCQENGAVELYHNNIRILTTGSGGSADANKGQIDIQGKIHTQLGNNGINSFNKETTGDQIRFNTTGTTRGSISSNGSTVAFNTSASDRSMKKNFENWTEDTLNLFKNIKPQKFNFLDQEDGTNKEKGFIAQDMVASFPEAYIKNDDDKYMFNASGMVVYLMKALQEAVARIEVLEAK